MSGVDLDAVESGIAGSADSVAEISGYLLDLILAKAAADGRRV